MKPTRPKATKRTIGKPGATRGRKLPPEILTRDEILALIRACSNRAPTGIRNRALIVTLWRGGLRISEALNLRPKDIDIDAGTVRILHGKGNIARTIGLDPDAFAIIARWLDRRRTLGINGGSTVFCTLDGGPLKDSYVRAMLHRKAAKAMIEKRCNPHSLRHSHAAELASEGVPVNTIQMQLGHTNLATTSRYLQHIAPVEVVEAMRARRWSLDGKPVAPAPTPEQIEAVLRWIKEHETERAGSPPRGDREPAGVTGRGGRRSRKRAR